MSVVSPKEIELAIEKLNPPMGSSGVNKPCEHKYILLSSNRYSCISEATLRMEQYTEDVFYCEKCLNYQTKRR